MEITIEEAARIKLAIAAAARRQAASEENQRRLDEAGLPSSIYGVPVLVETRIPEPSEN